MIEALGKLIEEPEKRKMYLVFAIKMIFSGMLTSYLYNKFVGKYFLLNPLSDTFYTDLYNFVFSGRILIVFLLFICSSVALFIILTKIISSLIRLVYRERMGKKELKDATLVRIVLNLTGAVKIDRKKNTIGRGKDFDSFYEMMALYRKKSFKKAIKNFKNSLMTEIMHLYFIFVILYYTIMDFSPNKFLNAMIISAGIVLLYFHVTLQSLTRFLDVNENELLRMIQMLKAEEYVGEILEQNYISLAATEKSYLSPFAKTIETVNDKIYIDFYAGHIPITIDMEEKMIKTKEKHGWSDILIINCSEFRKDAAEYSNSNVSVISSKNKKTIEAKIRKLVFERQEDTAGN